MFYNPEKVCFQKNDQLFQQNFRIIFRYYNNFLLNLTLEEFEKLKICSGNIDLNTVRVLIIFIVPRGNLFNNVNEK